jgi:hypothetical protein
MVKLAGPMMSLEASGTIANAITFAKWKGRPYARQRVIPTNPKSVKQVSVRAMMTFLTQYWASQTAPNKATWDVAAKAAAISTFNAYVAANCSRWGHFLGPSKADPATEVGTAPAAPTTTITNQVKELSLSIVDGADVPDWGWMIFRSTVTGFTPSISNLVAVIPRVGTPTVFVDTNLTTAVPYYYRIKGFMATAKLGVLEAETTGTPT